MPWKIKKNKIKNKIIIRRKTHARRLDLLSLFLFLFISFDFCVCPNASRVPLIAHWYYLHFPSLHINWGRLFSSACGMCTGANTMARQPFSLYWLGRIGRVIHFNWLVRYYLITSAIINDYSSCSPWVVTTKKLAVDLTATSNDSTTNSNVNHW